MYMCVHVLCMKIYSYVYECIVVVDILRHKNITIYRVIYLLLYTRICMYT